MIAAQYDRPRVAPDHGFHGLFDPLQHILPVAAVDVADVAVIDPGCVRPQGQAGPPDRGGTKTGTGGDAVAGVARHPNDFDPLPRSLPGRAWPSEQRRDVHGRASPIS